MLSPLSPLSNLGGLLTQAYSFSSYSLAILWMPYEELQMSLLERLCGGEPADRLLLLLLRHFSRVQLCATPQMAAYQAPLSPGFSKQEHWNGLPFLPPMYESESEVTQSFLTFSHPMDCSAPGSSIHGIFQARVLEWGAVAISTRYLHAAPNLLSIYPLFFVPEELKQ